MKYYIVAGEASGDLHGSNLMKGLYEEDPQADIRFWGGELMDKVFRSRQSGTGLVRHYKGGAVMGFTQILLNAGKYLGKLRECRRDILRWKPDVVILIDYPGFNFRIAEFAHKRGFKVFYYIAPKVWASRESRVRKLKEIIDRLFIVFPFEKEYFSRHGVEYIYHGNPIIDAVDASPGLAMPREELLAEAGLPDKPYVAILAGSRKGEVESMMPVCAEFARRMKALPGYSDYNFIVAGAPSRSPEDYAPYIAGMERFVKVLFGRTHAILRHATAAVVNSGTASLETCLIGTPQVAAYNVAPLNFMIGRQIIKVKFISLGNLILDKKAFKELIQYYFTPENLLDEVRRLIEDKEYRQGMQEDYRKIREALGGSGASARIAKAMIEKLRAIQTERS